MLLIAQTQMGTVICLAALVVIIGFVLMRTQRSVSRQTRDSSGRLSSPRPEREQPDHHLQAPTDVLRWEVSMHETARDLTAQLDSKLGLLQQLIREADRAAARLEKALQAADDRREDAPVGHFAELPATTVQSRPVSQAEALRSAGSGAEDPKPAGREQPAGRSADVRYQEIYLLADYGYPAAEIAQRLGSPVGEIELILSLRGKR
jgi:hypothetical protein